MTNLVDYEISSTVGEPTENTDGPATQSRSDEICTLPLWLTGEEVLSLLAFAVAWAPEYSATEETLVAKLRVHLNDMHRPQSAIGYGEN